MTVSKQFINPGCFYATTVVIPILFLSSPCQSIYWGELSAITVLFNLHEGTTNTQHKRESTTQGCVSYGWIAAIEFPSFKSCLK